MVKVCRILAVMAALGLVGGCASQGKENSFTNALKDMYETYQKQNATIEKDLAAAEQRGIDKLTATKSGSDYLVSLDLKNASLSVVIDRLAKETELTPDYQTTILGKVTLHLDNVPLTATLKKLLEPENIVASVDNGKITFADAPEPVLLNPGVIISKEVPINYMDSDIVAKIMQDLFPRPTMGSTGGPPLGMPPGAGGPPLGMMPPVGGPPKAPGMLAYSVHPSRNVVYLSGPASDVLHAARILRKADHDASHVLIEAFVVEFDSDSLMQLGSQVQGLGSGEISALTTAFGNLTTVASGGAGAANALMFTRTAGATNVNAFTAIINFMVARNKARYITRPYLSTMSGKQANMYITRDRYIVTQTIAGSLPIVSPAPITSGVTLSITPYVHPGNQIRMDVGVENSQFSNTASGSVAVEVTKNKANTSMIIQNGQAIIIGGLGLNQENDVKSGVPYLYEIPGMNLLFGADSVKITRQQVLIYLSAYIWHPDLELPIHNKDAFSIPPEKAVEPHEIQRLQ